MTESFIKSLSKIGFKEALFDAYNTSSLKQKEKKYKSLITELLNIHENNLRRQNPQTHKKETRKKETRENVIINGELGLQHSFYDSLFKNSVLSKIKLNNFKKYINNDKVFNYFIDILKEELKDSLDVPYKSKNSKDLKLNDRSKLISRYVSKYESGNIFKRYDELNKIISGEINDDNLDEEEARKEKISLAQEAAKLYKYPDWEKIDSEEKADEYIEKIKKELYKEEDEYDNVSFKETEERYPFSEKVLKFLEQANKIIKLENNENDILKKLISLSKNYKLDNISSMANKLSQTIRKEIEDIKNSNDEEIKSNLPYYKKVADNSLELIEQGFSDYFFIRANELIQKSKLSNKTKTKSNDLAKKAEKNLAKNWFITKIILPIKDDKKYYNILKNQAKDLNQRINFVELKKRINRREGNTIEDRIIKENNKEKPTLSMEEGKRLLNLQRKFRAFLNTLQPSDEKLKQEIERFRELGETAIKTAKAKELEKELDFLPYDEKNNVYFGIYTNNEKIRRILDVLYSIFSVSKNAGENISSKQVQKSKFPIIDNNSGYERFIIPKMNDQEVSGPSVWDSKTNTFRPFIEVMEERYPKEVYEYVKYIPKSQSNVFNIDDSDKKGKALKASLDYQNRFFKDSNGYTLALYDENKNLLRPEQYNKAKFVRKLDPENNPEDKKYLKKWRKNEIKKIIERRKRETK